MRRAALATLLLAACHDGSPEAPINVSAGARLEAAAVEAGLVTDPTRIDPVGAWARDTDRVCIVPAKAARQYRIGAVVDYGPGQGCAASGTATRDGAKISVTFGKCRFDARLRGDRLEFPAAIPASCDSLCHGRASFAALNVDHLSTSLSEAATLRAPDRTPLCTD